MDKATAITGGTQIVSQLRSNQKVSNRNGSEVTLKAYFARRKGVETRLMIRGGKEKQVTIQAGRKLGRNYRFKKLIPAPVDACLWQSPTKVLS